MMCLETLGPTNAPGHLGIWAGSSARDTGAGYSQGLSWAPSVGRLSLIHRDKPLLELFLHHDTQGTALTYSCLATSAAETARLGDVFQNPTYVNRASWTSPSWSCSLSI